MRKSLLMTSVLGLAMPTLAMANAAAAGSSSAVCGSGFFAQFDAKIMNAKLEIKNEKGNKSTVPADEETDADKITDAAAKDVIAQLKNAQFEVLFGYGDGLGKEAFLATIIGGARVEEIRGKSRADVEDLISAIIGGSANGVSLIGKTDADKKAFLAQTNYAMVAPTTAPAEAAKTFDNVVSDVITIVNSIDPSVKTGKLSDRLQQTYNYVARRAGNTAAQTAERLVSNMQNGYYRPNMGGKIYVANLGADFTPQYLSDLRTAVNTKLDDNTITLDPLKTANSILEFAKTSADKNTKLNEQYKALKTFDRIDQRVHSHALAGGVGATVGWWQNLGGFALSISGSGDYLWGTFRTVDDKAGDTVKAEDKRKLGFGLQGDIGVHYIVSPSTTLGILIGLRGQQLNFGRINTAANQTANNKDSKGDYASKWMINPVGGLQVRTFFADNVYCALFLGYLFPIKKKYNLENTNITNKDAEISLQGLTGGFSLGVML